MASKVAVDIRPGQKWRDRDRGRWEAGRIREFTVKDCGTYLIYCLDKNGHIFNSRRSRFGNAAANDRFELVE